MERIRSGRSRIHQASSSGAKAQVHRSKRRQEEPSAIPRSRLPSKPAMRSKAKSLDAEIHLVDSLVRSHNGGAKGRKRKPHQA